MRLDERERKFYEKESILNDWSLRELKRHFDSSLFDRVLLSKDKYHVLEDNLEKYHFPEKAEDIIKNPYILEFLGLEENSKYSETQLEEKIIEHLEKFLLEM
jgi:predicted nuclease of restriction endonuclease-like (RecB) superfamily